MSERLLVSVDSMSFLWFFLLGFRVFFALVFFLAVTSLMSDVTGF